MILNIFLHQLLLLSLTELLMMEFPGRSTEGLFHVTSLVKLGLLIGLEYLMVTDFWLERAMILFMIM
jgi:hypothetical protein